MLEEVLIFIIACLVLVKASSYAVTAVAHIARAMHLTEFVTSFLVVAIVSALPEAFISLGSALRGFPEFGIGTLLGGNIADLTLILGLVALAGHPIRIRSEIIKKDWYFVMLTILPILLGLNGVLSRFDAVILIVSGLVFLFILLKERSHFHKPYEDGNHIAIQIIIFIASIGAMIASAYFVISSSSTLALGLGIPIIVIGVILAALGTTLPEFTFSLQSIRKGHAELAIGDILGVVVVDATIIIGITALVQPVIINTFIFSLIGVFTAFAAVFALIFMRTDQVLSKEEALAMIFFYVVFVMVQVFIA